MIFLKDDVLLDRDLTFEDVKPRLLGKTASAPQPTGLIDALRILAEHDMSVA
jgi:hypothetical protein